MMGSPAPIPRPAAQDVLNTFLWAIRNHKALEKQAEEIETARKEANALISKVGKAKDIDRLHTDAAQRLADATGVETAAGKHAEKLVAEAEADAQTHRAEAKRTVDVANKRLLARERTVARAEETLEAAGNALADREDAVKELENKVAERELDAAGLVATYNAKIADLNEVLAKAGMKPVDG